MNHINFIDDYITMNNLINSLRHLDKVETAEIKTRTTVKIPKKQIPSVVVKETKAEVLIGKDYVAEVNERKAEGTEYVSGSTWGHHESAALVENKSKYYLEYFIDRDKKSEKKYFVDGREATDDELQSIRSYEFSKTILTKPQAECGITKENAVMVRRVALENILSLRFGNYEYHIDDVKSAA